MTDGNGSWQPAGGLGRGRTQPATLIGIALAVLLLASVGAVGGWMLAGDAETTDPNTAQGPGPSQTQSPTGQATSSTPSKPQTSASGLVVPELVGDDFEDARKDLLEHNLSVRVIFRARGAEDGKVARTDPPANTPVKSKTTVTLYVGGEAPAVTVPDVTGDDCDDAAKEVAEEGLVARVAGPAKGEVRLQHPAAEAKVRWGTPVTLTCGSGGEPNVPGGPTTSPTPEDSATPG